MLRISNTKSICFEEKINHYSSWINWAGNTFPSVVFLSSSATVLQLLLTAAVFCDAAIRSNICFDHLIENPIFHERWNEGIRFGVCDLWDELLQLIFEHLQRFNAVGAVAVCKVFTAGLQNLERFLQNGANEIPYFASGSVGNWDVR